MVKAKFYDPKLMRWKIMTNLMIGCDPELFIQNAGGRYVSAYGSFPGTKENPFVLKHGGIQVDGTALEFNINPASTLEEFLKNIEAVTTVMSKMTKKRDKSWSLCVKPTVVYEKSYFESLPEEAKRLGCDPDYCAYTGDENQPKEPDLPFRTGAGHLHVGWTDLEDVVNTSHFYDCIQMVKQLDAGLYIPSLLWDSDQKRRELYGRVGSFRPKHYGVEWRPLSNQWVSDPDLQEWLYLAIHQCNILLEAGVKLQNEQKIGEQIKAIRFDDYVPTKQEAEDFLFTLLEEYSFPEFPEEYLS